MQASCNKLYNTAMTAQSDPEFLNSCLKDLRAQLEAIDEDLRFNGLGEPPRDDRWGYR